MDVYYEKGPFLLMVGKDFPRDESFMLVQRGGPLNVTSAKGLDREDGGTTREATVWLKDGFSVSIEYSHSTASGCEVHQLVLMKHDESRDQSFCDFRADGSRGDAIHIEYDDGDREWTVISLVRVHRDDLPASSEMN